MHPSRFRRLAAACRPFSLVIFAALVLVCAASASAAADTMVSGLVVDETGRPIPRAFVRALDDAGVETARAFADEGGRFVLDVPDAGGCRIEARLTGFAPNEVTCGAPGRSLRLELAVAPIRETILVSATRTRAPTSQVGASATVFTADDLTRLQTPLLADLLATTPGAMVVRSGAPGALTSLFVRGGESDYNKILLDGVPLNEPGGTYFLNSLTTEHLEGVEIVRGANSALYGSDAMASVIQLFTRRLDRTTRRPRGSVQFDGGTYGTWRGTAGVSGGAGRFDYSLGAAQRASDNRSPNSRFENTTLSANVGVAVGSRATLRFIGRGELAHVGTPGPTAFGRPDLDAFFERQDGIASVGFDQQTTAAFRQRASYSLATSRQTSTNLLLDPPYVATFEGRTATWTSTDFLHDSRADLRRHHASYQADWRPSGRVSSGEQHVTLLMDWDGERATQRDRIAGTETRHARDNFGVSAQHQILWRRVFLTLSGRVERNENFGAAAVPRAAVVHVLREGAAFFGETRVRASGGTGIKEPTLLESFSVSPYFRGNLDLEPERSRSLEVGIEQRLAGDRAKVEVAWFANRFSDIISLRTNPETFEAQFFNVGVTRARGLELGLQAVPVPAVRVRAGYTWLASRIVATTAPGNPLFAHGQWAFRRPRHSGTVGATLRWRRLAADVDGVLVGRFVDSDFGLFLPALVENPGRTTWDARVALNLTTRLTGIVAADNLTDRDYSEPLGYQPLRRAIRAGVRVEF